MSGSLTPRGMQHARSLCPLPSPGVCSNSCPLSQWCYLIISSSATLFFCLSSFPAPRSFPMNRLFTSGGQSLKLQLQHQSFQWIFRVDFFRIDWFDLLVVQGILKSLLQHHNLKASVLRHSAFFMVHLSHSYMTTGKTIALTIQAFVSKVTSLLFNTLSRFVIVDCFNAIPVKIPLGRGNTLTKWTWSSPF